MRTFDSYLDDLFEAGQVSDRKLQRYGSEHIALLASDERFTTLAADSLTVYEAYFGAANTEAIHGSIQTGLTAAKDRVFQEFKDLASQHEGAIKSTWGKQSPEYLRFYPRGITEYHQATLAEIGTLLARYESGIVEHREELPAKMVAAFIEPTTDQEPGGVIPRLRAALKDQSRAKADKLGSKKEKKETRKELTWQLSENLLTVAKTVMRGTDTEKREAMRLFPQHLLHGRTSAGDDDGAANDDRDRGEAVLGEDEGVATTTNPEVESALSS